MKRAAALAAAVVAVDARSLFAASGQRGLIGRQIFLQIYIDVLLYNTTNIM